jgi:hypothetical protein
MVAAFKSEIGPAQQQGGIFPGIVILQVPLPPSLCLSLCLCLSLSLSLCFSLSLSLIPLR